MKWICIHHIHFINRMNRNGKWLAWKAIVIQKYTGSIPLQKKTGCPSCWSALGRQPPTGRPFTDYARCRELSCPPLLGQLRTTLKDHCRGPVGFLWGLLGLLLNLQHRSTSPPAPFSFLLPSQSFALKATSWPSTVHAWFHLRDFSGEPNPQHLVARLGWESRWKYGVWEPSHALVWLVTRTPSLVTGGDSPWCKAVSLMA